MDGEFVVRWSIQFHAAATANLGSRGEAHAPLVAVGMACSVLTICRASAWLIGRRHHFLIWRISLCGFFSCPTY
ncbi:hypothetical protein BDW71DRAFT_172795 [Aspergillus fruticulosus]